MADIEGLRQKHVAEIEERLEALQAPYQEYMELADYRDMLKGTTARPRRSSMSSGARRSPARSGGVNRSRDFMQVLDDADGPLDVAAIAKAVPDVKQNYFYRVKEALLDEGLIESADGKHFSLTDAGREALHKMQTPAAA